MVLGGFRSFHVLVTTLSSFSAGPWYKNVVRGTSHVVRMNPGGWFKHVLAIHLSTDPSI